MNLWKRRKAQKRLPGELLDLIPAWTNLYAEFKNAGYMQDLPLAGAIESFRKEFLDVMQTVKEIKGDGQ